MTFFCPNNFICLIKTAANCFSSTNNKLGSTSLIVGIIFYTNILKHGIIYSQNTSIVTELENKQIPLPEKEEGTQKDIEAREKTATVEEAKQLFEISKKRLLDVNFWDKICGKASAVFKLTDERGNEVEGSPKVGYHFKIDVPAPGSKAGTGFDWVRVEAIEEDENRHEDREFLLIRVRPSENPLTDSNDVAHFFSDKSTSNFLVLREKNVVTAAVIGRNEITNTSGTVSWLDKLRNAVVGTGAVGGLSNPQWKALVNGVLGKE